MEHIFAYAQEYLTFLHDSFHFWVKHQEEPKFTHEINHRSWIVLAMRIAKFCLRQL